MRDLVVAREGRVDGGPSFHHVREYAEDDQVAHEDTERGAHERVDASSFPAWPDVSSDRQQRGGPLEHHFPNEEHERAPDVEAVGEERPVAARVCLPLGLDTTHSEDHMVGLAREEISSTGSAISE